MTQRPKKHNDNNTDKGIPENCKMWEEKSKRKRNKNQVQQFVLWNFTVPSFPLQTTRDSSGAGGSRQVFVATHPHVNFKENK